MRLIENRFPGRARRAPMHSASVSRWGKVLGAATLVLRVGQAFQPAALAQSSFGGEQGVRNPVSASVSPAAVAAAGALLAANNGSDIPNPAVFWANLGGGTAGLAALPSVGAPGAFSSLEQWVPQTLPAASASLACTGTPGNFPFNDDYIGKLSGANVTYTLPTTGCADGSIITEDILQDGSHTVTNQTSAAGGIIGSPTFSIGASAGNSQQLQYQFCAARCGAGLNQNAWILRSDIVYPAQPWPVAAGGMGLATLTAHALYAGNGTAAPSAIGPDSSTGKPLISQGSSADPVYGVAAQAGGGTGAASLSAANILQTTISASGNPIFNDSNSTATNNWYTGTVTGGTIGANGCLEFRASACVLYNDNTADTLTVTVSYGGSTIFSSAEKPNALSANYRPYILKVRACNLNSASAQDWWFESAMGAGANSSNCFSNAPTTSNFAHFGVNSSTVNSGSDQTLTVSTAWNTGTTTNVINGYEAKAWLMP
jgi:hypothetical protein